MGCNLLHFAVPHSTNSVAAGWRECKLPLRSEARITPNALSITNDRYGINRKLILADRGHPIPQPLVYSLQRGTESPTFIPARR